MQGDRDPIKCVRFTGLFLSGGGAARPKGVQKWGPELSLRSQRGWLTARSRPTGLGLQ